MGVPRDGGTGRQSIYEVGMGTRNLVSQVLT